MAITYDTASSTFDWSKVSTKGGDRAGPGTVYLKGSQQQYGSLSVDYKSSWMDRTIVKATQVPAGRYDRFEVRNNAWVEVVGLLPEGSAVEVSGAGSSLMLQGGVTHKLSTLKVTGTSASVSVQPSADGQPLPLQLEVASVEVGTGASINANAAGYLGGRRGVNGAQSGRTTGNVSTGRTDVGGSYGGHGRAQNGASVVPVYGDPLSPSDFGSGGSAQSNASSKGGNGGGLLLLTVDSLKLDGALQANGEHSYAYGGAGGGIRLDVRSVTGSGFISAEGSPYDSLGYGTG
ncbi:hypothetical protein HMI49_42415, partial [Corallococcus exercitus]|nr:hypothetical protein [Corallococcus exercitus]